MTDSTPVGVSVVVRTKNEASHLGQVLETVAAQTLADHEVIVVDSGSTDRTLEIAHSFQVRLIEISPDQFTYGRALNLGFDQARGEFVACLSAHAVPASTNWLETLAKNFLDPRVAGVYGRHLPLPDCHPLDARAIHRRYPERKRVQADVDFFSNSNSMIRRSIWVHQPFDETLPASEDYLWAREVQRRALLIVYEPFASVYHSHDETYEQMYKRMFAIARAMAVLEAGERRLAFCRLLARLTVGAVVDIHVVLGRGLGAGVLGHAIRRRFWIEWGRYQGGRATTRHFTENPSSENLGRPRAL